MEKVKCKCGHEWIPRVDNPKRCPVCGSWNWKGDTNIAVDPYEEETFVDIELPTEEKIIGKPNNSDSILLE